MRITRRRRWRRNRGMRGWLRSWFSKAAHVPIAEKKRYHDPRWDLVPTEAEIDYVADCLQTFAKNGLILNEPGNKDVAIRVATEVLQSLAGTDRIAPVVPSLNRIVQIRGGGAPLNVLWYQDKTKGMSRYSLTLECFKIIVMTERPGATLLI